LWALQVVEGTDEDCSGPRIVLVPTRIQRMAFIVFAKSHGFDAEGRFNFRVSAARRFAASMAKHEKTFAVPSVRDFSVLVYSRCARLPRPPLIDISGRGRQKSRFTDELDRGVSSKAHDRPFSVGPASAY